MEIINWIHQEMTKRRWSQTQLAREAGITKGALSHVLKGTRHAGPAILKGLARALEVPAADVFRMAGLLEDEPGDDEHVSLDEWIQIFKDADLSTRQFLLDNARQVLSTATEVQESREPVSRA